MPTQGLAKNAVLKARQDIVDLFGANVGIEICQQSRRVKQPDVHASFFLSALRSVSSRAVAPP